MERQRLRPRSVQSPPGAVAIPEPLRSGQRNHSGVVEVTTPESLAKRLRSRWSRTPESSVGSASSRAGLRATPRRGSGAAADRVPAAPLETSATMKFSGGTGAPASRRSSASWPAWVIASENGPCSSCAAVIPCERVAALQVRGERRDHRVEARDLGGEVGQRIGPVAAADEVRARVAEDAGHVAHQLGRRAHVVARRERAEVGRRVAQRFLRAIGECGEEVGQQGPRASSIGSRYLTAGLAAGGGPRLATVEACDLPRTVERDPIRACPVTRSHARKMRELLRSLFGLEAAAPRPARRDRFGALRPAHAGGDADRRRQVALLPAASAPPARDDGRRVAADRPDARSARQADRARRGLGAGQQRGARRRGAGGARADRRRGHRVLLHHARAAGAPGAAREADEGQRRSLRDRRGALPQPVGPRLPARTTWDWPTSCDRWARRRCWR